VKSRTKFPARTLGIGVAVVAAKVVEAVWTANGSSRPYDLRAQFQAWGDTGKISGNAKTAARARFQSAHWKAADDRRITRRTAQIPPIKTLDIQAMFINSSKTITEIRYMSATTLNPSLSYPQ
jgi:hypothetical protein